MSKMFIPTRNFLSSMSRPATRMSATEKSEL